MCSSHVGGTDVSAMVAVFQKPKVGLLSALQKQMFLLPTLTPGPPPVGFMWLAWLSSFLFFFLSWLPGSLTPKGEKGRGKQEKRGEAIMRDNLIYVHCDSGFLDSLRYNSHRKTKERETRDLPCCPCALKF